MARLLEHVKIIPPRRRYATPLLLLHGAWHGAWCWQDAMNDFAKRGFEVHAISLRGHGGSDVPRAFNLCGLRDYVADLRTAVEAISPRPVVVGHSMGGYVTQLYLMEHQLPGAVLLCSMPISGALRFFCGWMLRHPLAALRTALSLNSRHLIGTPALARTAFFRRDISLAQLALYTSLLGPDSLRIGPEAMLMTFPEPTRNRSRMLVIGAGADRIFTVAEQRATATAYNAELVMLPDATHDLMLDPAWPLAADSIERTVAEWERQ